MVVLNVDLSTWMTLRNLDDSIKFYNNKRNEDVNYDLSLKKTLKMKKEFIKEIYDCSC